MSALGNTNKIMQTESEKSNETARQSPFKAGTGIEMRETKIKVSETYRANLRSWAQGEKARLGGISYREWARRIEEKLGLAIDHGTVERWCKGAYQKEMTPKALVALSRWRGDASPEATRQWLWGESLYDKNEADRIMGWLATAPLPNVLEVVKRGIDILTTCMAETSPGYLPEETLTPRLLPEIAIKMEQAGIPVESLLDRSWLDPEEREEAEAYLRGDMPEIRQSLLDHLNYNLSRLLEKINQDASPSIGAGIH